MIKAWVMRRGADLETPERTLGAFNFDQLPSPNDRVHLSHYNGTLGIYRVLCVAHEPTRDDEEIASDFLRSTVYVELIREMGVPAILGPIHT